MELVLPVMIQFDNICHKLFILCFQTGVELCAYWTSGPVRKQFTCRKRILLSEKNSSGQENYYWTLRTVWTLTLTLPRTPWSLRTLPSASREISSGSHRTANYRSPGRHRGDSLCHRQGFPDKKWEFIKLGKILPFHGNVAVELTLMYILGDTEKKGLQNIHSGLAFKVSVSRNTWQFSTCSVSPSPVSALALVRTPECSLNMSKAMDK